MVLGRRVRIGVLGLEVGDDVRVVALAQPVVVVDARVAEGAQFMRATIGDRGRGRRHNSVILARRCADGCPRVRAPFLVGHEEPSRSVWRHEVWTATIVWGR